MIRLKSVNKFIRKDFRFNFLEENQKKNNHMKRIVGNKPFSNSSTSRMRLSHQFTKQKKIFILPWCPFLSFLSTLSLLSSSWSLYFCNLQLRIFSRSFHGFPFVSILKSPGSILYHEQNNMEYTVSTQSTRETRKISNR